VVVGQPGFAQHVEVRLAVQVRCQVTVHPGVVGHRSRSGGDIGISGHFVKNSDGLRQPAHQLRLHMAVDFTLVDRDALEPALVLFEAKQRAGIVEEHGLDSHSTHLTTRPSGLVCQHFSFTFVVSHRRGLVELVGGLGVAAEPGQ